MRLTSYEINQRKKYGRGKKRRRQRRGSEPSGRINIGNVKGPKKFCTYCRPKLANSLARREDARLLLEEGKKCNDEHNLGYYLL